MKIIHLFLLIMNFSLFFCNFEIPFKYQYPKKNADEFLFNYFHNDLIVENPNSSSPIKESDICFDVSDEFGLYIFS